MFFFFKQKTAYEMRISDWSSDVCSSDLGALVQDHVAVDEIPAEPLGDPASNRGLACSRQAEQHDVAIGRHGPTLRVRSEHGRRSGRMASCPPLPASRTASPTS